MQTEAVKKRGNRKTRVGVVASDKMDKTIVVVVEKRVLHPVYKKYVKTRKRYKADDQANTAKIGDQVMIEECRPLSKTKRWRLKNIVRRAQIL